MIGTGKKVSTVSVRPWLVATFGILGFAFFSAYIAATGYLVFRDDLLAASIARQARIQHAYEDRIALLRADIDRLTSRHLLNQQAFDDKLQKLLGRQAALDTRQDIIAGLSQAARRAGLTPSDAAPPKPVPNPRALRDTDSGNPSITGSIERQSASPQAFTGIALRPSMVDETPRQAPNIRVAELENSLETLAHQQVAYVGQIAGEVGQRAEKISTILTELGHPSPAEIPADISGTGGPFISLAPSVDPEKFQSSVGLITAEIERLAAAKARAHQLPLAKPVADIAITSRFGKRIDPFLRRPAMHTGIDFRTPKGHPVRSTAAGKVVTAKFNGGYGKMVEIDHGNGVTTRYSHLSRISVKTGQRISKGALVGRAGSTGRSTGPHLHYEVRIDDNAIDPMRYIRAGSELDPLL